MAPMTELLVVSYFGKSAEPFWEQLLPEGIRTRHATGLESLRAELGGARPYCVVVDRWLPGDEAEACVALARDVHQLPTLLMVARGDSSAASRELAEAVDGVLEKPLETGSLLESLGTLSGRPAREGPAADQNNGAAEVETDRSSGAGADPGAATGTGEWPETTGHGALHLLDEVRETLRRLGEVIKIDSISGLLSRDFFLERVAREVKRAIRYDQPLSALMIDVDDFKAINDEHGHEVGNDVLARVGKVIDGTIRRDLDLASRLYGDEFCVVLPATDATGAGSLARRILRLLAEAGESVPFSASAGVQSLAGRELEGNGVRALLHGADQAMLAAKRQGKGMVRFSGSEGEADLFAAASDGRASADGHAPPEVEPDPTDEENSPGQPVEAAAPPQPAAIPAPGGPVPASEVGLPVGESPAAETGEDGESEPEDPERTAVFDGGDGHGPDEGPSDDDPLAAALADAVATLADEEDLKQSERFRGKVLLVSREADVAAILVEFLGRRGLPVETAPDFAAALTLLDSLEFFLVLADASVDSAETRAFCEAASRVDSEIYLFLFTDAAEAGADRLGLPGNILLIRRPFLLSELYLEATRVREDYHLRQLGQGARPEPGAGAE